MRIVLRFAGRVLATVVVVLSGVALIVGMIVPWLAGATPYTVLSGSMAPTLRAGELIIVRPAERISTGDVITYQVRPGESEVVTHRVIGVGMTVAGERIYQTRGDANEIADVTAVRTAQVRGVLWYHVPYLGHVSAWLSGAPIQGLVAVALLAYAGWSVLQAARERKRREVPQPEDREAKATGGGMR